MGLGRECQLVSAKRGTGQQEIGLDEKCKRGTGQQEMGLDKICPTLFTKRGAGDKEMGGSFIFHTKGIF